MGQGYLFSKPLPPMEFLSKFQQIEMIIARDGMYPKAWKQEWLQEALNKTKQELADTLSYQEGMTFKFTRRNGKFIHTMCDGQLLYNLGLTLEQVVGKELKELLPREDAERKLQCYINGHGVGKKMSYTKEGSMTSRVRDSGWEQDFAG
ncbi:hypothetical protein [Alicyclobacillus herbarius]|uniref:hypothetical protein n=1 Tax=Alicyclobacillus herbarius TaxID=122960 RepID=UPI001FE16E21|nr:hypothetical protein [Alicyclobacillus herbarius]